MSQNTIYGAAVVLEKDKQIYLSRRSEGLTFPKKWQFVNGRISGTEQSNDCAIRIIEGQTGLKIADKSRLYFGDLLTLDDTNEFYYVYFLHLNDDELPVNTCDRWRGDWKAFELKKALVLDVVPGIRDIIRKLFIGLSKFEKKQSAIQKEEERITQQLSPAERLHLQSLGPKMTRAGLGGLGYNAT